MRRGNLEKPRCYCAAKGKAAVTRSGGIETGRFQSQPVETISVSHRLYVGKVPDNI